VGQIKELKHIYKLLLKAQKPHHKQDGPLRLSGEHEGRGRRRTRRDCPGLIRLKEDEKRGGSTHQTLSEQQGKKKEVKEYFQEVRIWTGENEIIEGEHGRE